MVHDEFGEIGIAGFFCNGEFGPVGTQTFLHGYTASLVLFVGQTPPRSYPRQLNEADPPQRYEA